jgi:TctA family transporter
MVFGGIGYLIRKLKFEAAPLILGFILGPMIEVAFRQSLLISSGKFSVFVSRPISLGFFVITVALLISSPLMTWLKKRYREPEK